MVGGLAIAAACAMPAGAQVEVTAPVPLPAIELPAVPAPVPVPVPPPVALPVPVPVPAPPAVELPPVTAAAPQVSAPSLPAPAPDVRVGPAVESAGSALRDEGANGDEGADPGTRRRESRRGIHGTRYRKRDRLVRGLRGCLDRLPRMQRSALILRYGVGHVDRRSARRAADVMDVSRVRFRWLERRGVRALTVAARGGSCERTGVSRRTYAAVYRLIESEQSRGGRLALALSAGDAVRVVRTSAPVSGDTAAGGVAGAQRSGGSDANEREADDRGGLALPTPLGELRATPDSPLFLLFVALAVAAAGFAARSIVRAVR